MKSIISCSAAGEHRLLMRFKLKCDKGLNNNLFVREFHVTSAIPIPEPAASDILSYTEKSQERYKWLVENPILEGSPESIRDPLP